ncbi:MAG TPA: ATP-binding protein [Actinomycetota bacterium]|nr:ATP-binding protein [Actinomycetota bacterium]
MTRVWGAVEFPARFTLIAGANPCPCGYDGDSVRQCECLPHRVRLYRQKLSGPLLDRIDLRLAVPRLSRRELLEEAPGEPSAAVRDRVEEARERQGRRYAGPPLSLQRPGARAARAAHGEGVGPGMRPAGPGGGDVRPTGGGFDRAIKVARTIADLAGAELVGAVSEALSYRMDLAGEGLARAG